MRLCTTLFLIFAWVAVTQPLASAAKQKSDTLGWTHSEDPKSFTLGFYKWYYAKARALKGEQPVLSEREDIAPVIAGCVSPALVKAARRFEETDAEEGMRVFMPGTDSDPFWGDHATVVKIGQEGGRTRVTVFLKGISAGYEKLHQSDAVVLEKRGSNWMIVENAPVTAPEKVPPKAIPQADALAEGHRMLQRLLVEKASPSQPVADSGGVKFVSPSKAYGVIIKEEDEQIVFADLVALPSRKALHRLCEPEGNNPSIDLQWNPASTQAVFFWEFRSSGVSSLIVMNGEKIVRRELPEITVPILKEYGDRIKKQPFDSLRPQRWLDDETLLLQNQGRLMIGNENNDETYRIDYEYEVTLKCPLEKEIQILEVKEVSVKRVKG